MKKTVFFACVFIYIIIQTTVYSQSNKKELSKIYSEAVAYAEDKNYHEAISLLKRLVSEDPERPEVLYYLGYCYLNCTNGADSAVIFFQRGLMVLPEADRNSSLGVDLQYSVAKSYHLQMKFDQAIDEFEKLLLIIPDEDVEMQDRIKREIETCSNGKELVNKPVKLEVVNLGDAINSGDDDHSPLISADGELIFYTTRRESEYNELLPDGQYSEKIFYSKKTGDKWTKGDIISKLFRKDGHESCVALSADGQELYLYRNDIEGRNLYVCLYDGSSWSEPTKLPKPINSIYDETHVTLSPDKSVMYFTSSRPGGYGGLDIYEVRRLPDGKWASPKNLGSEVNTKYDEETPMLHPDGRTLYFASEGHNCMGGFDIFISRIQPDSIWSKPVNMGYPINTPDDDFFFVPTVSYNQAYYASSRFEDNHGGMDIYLVQYEEPVENRLAVLKGTIQSENDAPIETVRVFVFEKESGDLVGQYCPHAGTGKYVMILEAEKIYELKYSGEGFEDYVANLPVTRNMTYSNLQAAKKVDDVTMASIVKEEPKQTTDVAVSDVKPLDANDDIPYYTVQILTLNKPVISWEDAFKGLDTTLVKEYKCKNSMYRYAYGLFKGYKATLKVKEEVLKVSPFSDSFIRDVKQYDDLIETADDKK
ncbi:MAG: PD40 domain-containing protein [Marinilabiliaceae bacterium]|nr:PD40 domain-containing protein [Marinilabiliaceae bacterium]